MARVSAHMRLQVGQLSKRLLAAGHFALVRPLARVSPPVLPQVRQLREPLITVLAPVRLLARVNAAMLIEMHLLTKVLEAVRALVRSLAALGALVAIRRAVRVVQIVLAAHRTAAVQIIVLVVRLWLLLRLLCIVMVMLWSLLVLVRC